MPSTSKSVEIVHAPQGEMQPSKTLNKFIVNIGYGGIRGSVLFANTLVLTPILISRLGREQFAILALATPFLRYGFNGVFDMGLATALVRFVSRDFASGDYRSINKYFASAFLLYIVSGIVLLSLYSLVSPLILRSLLGINMPLYLTARTALWQLLCTYVL